MEMLKPESMNRYSVQTGAPLGERLEEPENAIRTVYASTMSLSALDYRKRRGLDKRDEQMALLIQRVSGLIMVLIICPVLLVLAIPTVHTNSLRTSNQRLEC